jgi:hypothetical protein
MQTQTASLVGYLEPKMKTMTRVSAVQAQVRDSQETDAGYDLTDLCLRTGEIGRIDLCAGW